MRVRWFVPGALVTAALTAAAFLVEAPPAPRPEAPQAVDAPVMQVVPKRATRTREVLPLRGVVTPDLLVTSATPLTREQVARLRQVRGVVALAQLSTGTVQVGTRRVTALGVDPSSFRAFTPRETAASDALWQAVARGELAASYASKLPLGRRVSVQGRPMRIGALASYGAVQADVLVDASVPLGLRATSVLLAAPDRGIKGLKADVREVLGKGVDLERLRPVPVSYRRPKTYRELYQLSASYCPGLSWTVLAAIGQVESGHGRNVGPSTAGALGPMQFLPSTWAFAGVDGDGDGRADIMNAYDAVPAAALYLCRNGAGQGGQGLYNAIYSYNHADWYVREVLDLAARYR